MTLTDITLAESALRDLEAIRQWYTDEGVPDVGERLIREILRRIDSLQDQPRIGRVVPEFGQEFLRELVFTPFRIVYHHQDANIRIVRAWRSERLLRMPPER